MAFDKIERKLEITTPRAGLVKHSRGVLCLRFFMITPSQLLVSRDPPLPQCRNRVAPVHCRNDHELESQHRVEVCGVLLAFGRRSRWRERELLADDVALTRGGGRAEYELLRPCPRVLFE